MKKVLSCLLAVIMAFGCFSAVVYAAGEGFTKSYYIDVAPNFRSMIRITSVEEKDVPEEERQHTYYVKEGQPFSFTIEFGGGYRPDQTTVIKYGAVSQHQDMVANGYDEKYGTIIYPDANGVYTIAEVNEDIYIYTGLLNKKSISTVKDFLLNMFAFFRDLMLWFFGLV